jgi:acyl dehydratase/putative sterol carrier protein
VTGRILGAHGEHVFEYKMATTDGVRRDDWTIDSLAASVDAIGGNTAKAAAAPATPAAPAAAHTPADQVAEVFQRMPEGFLPDKAQGWNATMHFKVAGAGDFTVAVQDGVCTTAPTLEGAPTCEVGTDVDTFLGMVDGTVDGQQAFMQGKVTATNLADMMKYKGAFSKERAQANAASAPPTPAPTPVAATKPAAPPAAKSKGTDDKSAALADLDTLERVHWIFRLKRELFGDDPRPLTLTLTDDGVHSLGAAGDTADADDRDPVRVRTDSASLCAFLDGTLELKDAVERLAIVTTRMKDLLWFRETLEANDWRSVVEDAVRSRPVAITAAYKSKLFHGKPVVVSPEHAALYARATDDDNSAYNGDDGHPLAPPLLAVRYHHELAKQALTDPGLEVNLLRLVFGEQHMTFHAPLRVGDVLSPKCQLDSVEHKESGSVLRYRFSLMREGELVNETISSYFVRGEKKPGDKKADKEPYGGVTSPTLKESFTVRDDQSRDYALASLDDNPIHVDENIAKAAGFASIINHGLCTLALSARTLVDALGGHEPAQLHRVGARFSAPVFMGDRLTVRAAPAERDGERGYAFDVINPEGKPVVVDGFAVLHPRA